MFGNAIASSNDDQDYTENNSKRHDNRREDDRCVSVINGQMHPVQNWSNGGLLITADDRVFAIGQECTFTLKFKLRGKIMEVNHKAKVVRKAPNKVALQFLDLTKQVKSEFQKVVDDYVSQRFAESQSV